MKYNRIVIILLVASVPALASPEKQAREKSQQAKLAYDSGEYEKALQDWNDAAVDLPTSSELAFNRGLAHYRLGEFDKAREMFTEAVSSRDLMLEAKAKYNLGNCAYSEALQKMNDLQGAIDTLTEAIRFYSESLKLNPDDKDARMNIELAQLLIEDLIDKQKQQQEQQQQQQNQDQQNQDQQNKEQQDQQKQDQEQQGEQEKQDQQNQDKQGEQEKQDQQKSQGDQDEQQQNEQDRQQQSGDKKEEEQKEKEQQQQGEQKEEQQQEQQEAQQQQSQGEPQEEKRMSQQEAEALLQMIRDRERQRREDQKNSQPARLRPVQRDW